MKTKSIVAVFFISLMFISCKKESESNQLLIGKWEEDYTVSWEYRGLKKVEETKTVETLMPEYGESRTYEFTSSGKMIYQFANDKPEAGTYKVESDGKIITITEPDGNLTEMRISTLNSTKLVLEGAIYDEWEEITYWREIHLNRID